MKRVLTIASALSLVLMASVASAQIQYGFSLSDSNADPFSNNPGGVATGVPLIVWYACNSGDGLSAAEFAVTSSDGGSVFGASALAPFLNAGAGNQLLLAVGGCPDAPLPAAQIFVAGGASYSIAVSNNGFLAGVDCSADPQAWDADWIGYGVNGGGTAGFCEPTSVESNTWGQIKSLYK